MANMPRPAGTLRQCHHQIPWGLSMLRPSCFMRPISLAISLAAAVLLGTAAVNAQASKANAETSAEAAPVLLTKISYPKVLDMLAGTGITAELVTSDDGISYLVGTYRNTGFIMRLIECDTPKTESCTTLAIFANFVEEEGQKVSASDKAKINQYNENEVFGRAYFSSDGTSLGIDMVISIEGGVTETYFKAQLENWTTALGTFLSQLADPQ